MKKTTEKQDKFLKFVDSFCKDNGYSPSVRDIALGLGLSSTSGVQAMIDRLSAKGLLSKESGAARTLSLTNSRRLTEQYQQPKMNIPIYGRIKAGTPVTSEENIEGYIPLKNFLNGSSGGFFLIVEGDSMKDKGILNGDYVFIKPQKYIYNKEVGAFRLNGEVTLKTFSKTDEGIFLIPSNSDYEPIEVKDTDDFEVIGKFIMLLRMADKKYDQRFI